MPATNRQVLIFGCGSSGQRAFAALQDRVTIVGFADNNAKLHGTTFCDRPVFAPAALSGLAFDVVHIASMYHREIRTQLVQQLRLPESRIEVAPEFGAARPAPPPPRPVTDRNAILLAGLRNRHAGRRAFIIGNGPSLRVEDLEMLRRHGEVTIASNKIFLVFRNTTWRPTYFALEDMDIARRSFAEINRDLPGPTIVASYLERFLGPAPQRAFFQLIPRVAPPARPDFSLDLLRGINCGGTVTYSMLQIAAWLGVREVYLLGVDFSYNLGQLKEHDLDKRFKAYTYRPEEQTNYFARDYLAPGETIVAPDLISSLCAYESARERCHEHGPMRIFNATRGGKLEVFDRVEFDRLFPVVAPAAVPLVVPATRLKTLSRPGTTEVVGSDDDAAFLAGFVERLQPREMIEIGGGGFASANWLHVLAQLSGDGVPGGRVLHTFAVASSDAAAPADPASAMGSSQNTTWRHYFGRGAIDARPKFSGSGLPLVSLHGDHRHPRPALDLLAVLPCLAPGAWVVFPGAAAAPASGVQLLFSQWPGEKLAGAGSRAIRLPANFAWVPFWITALLEQEWETDVPVGLCRELQVPYHYPETLDDAAASAIEVTAARVRAAATQGRRVYLWGAGQAGQRCLRRLCARLAPVDGYVDRDASKHGRRLDDLPIHSPASLALPIPHVPQPFVVIASMYAPEIGRTLESLGYRARVDFVVA